MWKYLILCWAVVLTGCSATPKHTVEKHPDSSDWVPLFAADLSNADDPHQAWTVEAGAITASKD